jgi:hypothetical protein
MRSVRLLFRYLTTVTLTMTSRIFLLPGLLTLILFFTSGAIADEDSEARKLLRMMTEKLAGADNFTVTLQVAYDAVQKSGQQIEFAEIRNVAVKRPDYIKIDTRQSDGDVGGLRHDGATLTRFNKSENVYSQMDFSGDIDEALRYSIGTLGARIPLARLMVRTLPDELEKLSLEVDFVETNVLSVPATDHIAARGRSVDYQFWISDDHVLRRMTLTYLNVPGQPQLRANFLDWNFSPSIKETDFVFRPEKRMEKVPSLMPIAAPETPDSSSQESSDNE